MNNHISKITLDRPAKYRIIVPGEVRKLQLGMAAIDIQVLQSERSDEVISVISGTFDQAGLYGFLRRMYAMGLPLISVECLEFDRQILDSNKEKENNEE